MLSLKVKTRSLSVAETLDPLLLFRAVKRFSSVESNVARAKRRWASGEEVEFSSELVKEWLRAVSREAHR